LNHEARSYHQFRPVYPEALFSGLFPRKTTFTPEVLDLACGTGQSTASIAVHLALAKQSARISACDPDPDMIAAAQTDAPELGRWIVAPAEKLPYENAQFDAVVILSAYHWFDRDRADSEILRVLNPGGRLLIAEYQFPVAPSLPELNAWIRRSFNTTWKFPDQKPRGRLRDLTESLLTHTRVRSVRWERIPMEQNLTPAELTGLLSSQARFIAYLKTLGNPDDRAKHLEDTLREATRFMPEGRAKFDFRLTRVLAQLD
jgi:ubiquinone/menaquinone biosynthesis C-methylase UbiE